MGDRARRLIRSSVITATAAFAAASCASTADDPPVADASEAPATTSSTAAADPTDVVGGDLPDPADSGSSTAPDADPAAVDQACENFRTYVAANAPCEALVQPAEAPTCSAPDGSALSCSAVPRVARIAQTSGAVMGGQPLRPELEVTQFGRGPGPTNTSLLMFTEAALPAETADQLELAVVYEAAAEPGCEANGEAWDGGSFASVLRLGPGPPRVTDLGCRPDGFAEINQRSSWLISDDIVIVHLPVDLPGAPARVTGTFRSAPDFAFADGRIFTRRLDPEAWDFDEPIDP